MKKALATITTALIGTAQPTHSGVFNPHLFTLDNGMQVALIENHRLPIVTHMVWYKVGAMDEPQAKSGLAHFLEHLMFKGTDKIAEGEFSKTIARLGGEDNAFTSWDYTAYYQKVPVAHLPLVMEMESDRMGNLKLSQTAFETEKKVILEERSSVVESNPIRLFGEQLHASLYLNHPYSTPVIGWRHEIENLTYDDVLSFYKKYYRPDNAFLVVSGAVKLDELKTLAEKTYGTVKPGDKPIKRPKFTEPPHLVSRSLTMQRDEVQLPMLQRQYLAPKYGDGQNAINLQVAAQILGGGEISRLYQRLVVKEQLATSASVWYDPSRRGPGLFAFSVNAVDNKPETLARLDELITEELEKLQTEPPTKEELNRAISTLTNAAVYARDGVMGPAMAVGQILTIGLDIGYIEDWPEKIRAVEVGDVPTALKTLDNNAMVTGTLLP